MKKQFLLTLNVLLISGLMFNACKKKDDGTTNGSQNNVADLITVGNGWHIQQKSEVAHAYIGNEKTEAIDIAHYNNAFYEKHHTLLVTFIDIFQFRKTENNVATDYEPKKYISYLDAAYQGFFFLEGESQEYGYDVKNGTFNMYKDGVLDYSHLNGSEVYPMSDIYAYGLSTKLKYQINYDPYTATITSLHLPSGEKTRFKNYVGPDNSLYVGYNRNGCFVYDEAFTQNNPNHFKTYYASVVNFGNWQMNLNVAEFCDTISMTLGDPHSTGHIVINRREDTAFLKDLAGIGGDDFMGGTHIGGAESPDKVYFVLHGEDFRIYALDKQSHQLSLIKQLTGAAIPILDEKFKVYYRPVHNDLILAGQKIHKYDLSSSLLTDISPVMINNNRFTYHMCQVGERIYGAVSQMKSIYSDEKYYITNLFYYE